MARKRKRKAEEQAFGDPEVAAPQSARLTPVDVQQKVFRLAFRGYNERDVDEFLDRVTETLASLHEDNKRLRESTHERGGPSAASTAAAERQAAEIVRQAREHSARLVEAAERRMAQASGAEPAAAGAAMTGSFLARERDFLQRMASLIQDHARTLKEEARRTREGGPGSAGQGMAERAEESAATLEPAADDVTAMPAEHPETPAPQGAAVAEPPPAGEPEETAVVEPRPGGEPEKAPPEPEEAPAGPVEEGHLGDQEPSRLEPPTPGGPEAPASPPPEPGTAGFPPRARESGEEAPTVPWRPAESESPTEAGWSMEGSGEEGDPLLSAWESAFLSKPDDDASPGPAPRSDADREGEEPSLRELFWGEE